MKTVKAPKHVFVVMLENRSFDNLLGLSGFQPPIDGYSNTYKGHKYPIAQPAPTTMTTDPGHELPDVLQQLTNTVPDEWKPPLGPYPRHKIPRDFPNDTGFATNYATTTDEDNKDPEFPDPSHIGDIMKVFAPRQAPVLNTLASEFAVCTNWHSSIPGPTWPNRFFIHIGASSNLDCSPTTKQILEWSAWGSKGFPCPNGTIFQRLNGSYRLYHDMVSKWNHDSAFSDNPSEGGGLKGGGWVPQSSVLPGLSIRRDFWELKEYFEKDLNDSNGYPYKYTFIEPHYGNLTAETYKGGSSQHPMDDVYGGEALVKFVYETLRNSPLWDDSVLIVTYDEHGGFYDSVPPPAAVPPDDGSPGYGQKDTLNKFGFEFDQYGVRVPSIVVSPYIQKNTIDKNVYDHTSVLSTLAVLFDTGTFTKRDANAKNLLDLLTLETPRTDCPTTLPDPVKSTEKTVLPTPEEIAKTDKKPLPDSGNLIGTMGILLKMDLELSSQNIFTQFFIRRRFRRIKTLGDLRAYAQRVAKKLRKAKS